MADVVSFFEIFVRDCVSPKNLKELRSPPDVANPQFSGETKYRTKIDNLLSPMEWLHLHKPISVISKLPGGGRGVLSTIIGLDAKKRNRKCKRDIFVRDFVSPENCGFATSYGLRNSLIFQGVSGKSYDFAYGIPILLKYSIFGNDDLIFGNDDLIFVRSEWISYTVGSFESVVHPSRGIDSIRNWRYFRLNHA